MKTTFIVLSALLLMLSTMGSSCINDPFLISVNVDPLTGCYGINSGNGAIDDEIDVDLANLIDGSYVEKVKDARLYDIRVHVTGTYSGGSVTGQAFINDSLLFNFSGTWADFSTPQSLLGRSPHITPQGAGITELVRVLKARPLTVVTLRATGQATPSPYPSGTQFCVEVYAQADAEI